MDNTDNVNENKTHETRDQFAKLILATTAGFFAGKLAENAYMRFVESRRESTTEVQ